MRRMQSAVAWGSRYSRRYPVDVGPETGSFPQQSCNFMLYHYVNSGSHTFDED
jgi:hypothetical protein